MALACAAPDASASLVQGLAAYLECHAGGIGELGYKAFAGSTLLAALLTSCLIIYVALFGYRLIFMQDMDLRDLIVAAVRVGVIITFALHWNGYQAVVYRVVVEGPAELAGMVLQPQGLAVTTTSETAARLESTYKTLEQWPPIVTPNAAVAPATISSAVLPPNGVGQPIVPDARPTLTLGGMLLMISTLGPSAALQMAAALLLALGPVVIVLSLFDLFLGLLEGWLRALGGVLLGGCALAVVLALELNFLEMQVAGVAAGPYNDQDVLATAAIFGILGVGVLVAAGVAANGFRIPRGNPRLPRLWAHRSTAMLSPKLAVAQQSMAERPLGASRAQAVADAVAMRSQREQFHMTMEAGADRWTRSSEPSARVESTRAALQPLGYSLRSAGAPRRSLSIARRNAR